MVRFRQCRILRGFGSANMFAGNLGYVEAGKVRPRTFGQVRSMQGEGSDARVGRGSERSGVGAGSISAMTERCLGALCGFGAKGGLWSCVGLWLGVRECPGARTLGEESTTCLQTANWSHRIATRARAQRDTLQSGVASCTKVALCFFTSSLQAASCSSERRLLGREPSRGGPRRLCAIGPLA